MIASTAFTHESAYFDDGCKIRNIVSIYKGVTRKKNVSCANPCVFAIVLTNHTHIKRKDELSKTLLKCGCTIGANAPIVFGNSLGQYSMISAGAVVTSDKPDFALIFDDPTKQVGWVSRTGDILSDNLVCQSTGERYKINGEKKRLARR